MFFINSYSRKKMHSAGLAEAVATDSILGPGRMPAGRGGKYAVSADAVEAAKFHWSFFQFALHTRGNYALAHLHEWMAVREKDLPNNLPSS